MFHLINLFLVCSNKKNQTLVCCTMLDKFSGKLKPPPPFSDATPQEHTN